MYIWVDHFAGELSVKTVNIRGNSLFPRFRQFIMSEIIQTNTTTKKIIEVRYVDRNGSVAIMSK
jgi:hypothetical protein